MKDADSRGRFVRAHSVAYAFREMQGFAEDWKSLGYDDNDLFDLQDRISAWPKRAPVIAGTGGVRKFRFASSRQRAGKRSAARVCYACFENHGVVLLMGVYAKVSKSDVSASDKKAFRELIARAARELSGRQPKYR